MELHSQDLKMPHTMIMQDFGKGKYELSVSCESVCPSVYLSIQLSIQLSICLKMDYRLLLYPEFLYICFVTVSIFESAIKIN